jgi:hypothetical protein
VLLPHVEKKAVFCDDEDADVDEAEETQVRILEVVFEAD